MLFHYYFFFFFNDTATTEIYTLSLHDALPISAVGLSTRVETTVAIEFALSWNPLIKSNASAIRTIASTKRSEEHTSELQSRLHLVCRLLLEKKKNETTNDSEP